MYLVSVTYLADKRQIAVEFANKNNKIVRRYQFFPKMFFPLGKLSKNDFLDVISEYDSKRFKLDFQGSVVEVFAATFSDLKKINLLLHKYLGFNVNLVEPERQFLVAHGWSYFQPFIFDSELIALNSFEFPDVSLNVFSDSLFSTVSDLLSSNNLLAKDIIDRVVLSRLLRVPLVESESSVAHASIFLENIAFSSGFPVVYSAGKAHAPLFPFSSRSELDFSSVVSVLSASKPNNLGFETMNCSCCVPSSKADSNVLSSSFVKVKFLMDGVYFNSCSSVWANNFHNSMPFKEERSRRKKEYGYSVFPIGPFYRGDFHEVLLADANKLVDCKNAIIISDSSLVWSCTKKQSAFSAGVDFLRGLLVSSDAGISKASSSAVASNGLFFSQVLASNPEYFYLASLKSNALSLLSSFPELLTRSDGAFFNHGLAFSVESINAGVLDNFESLALGSNSRVNFRSSKVIVDSDSLLSVLNRFFGLYALEKLLIGLKNKALS